MSLLTKIYKDRTADYIIYKKDSKYYALNGHTGNIDNADSNAATLINAVLALPDAKRIAFSADEFTIDTTLTAFPGQNLRGFSSQSTLATSFKSTINDGASNLIEVNKGGAHTAYFTIKDIDCYDAGNTNDGLYIEELSSVLIETCTFRAFSGCGVHTDTCYLVNTINCNIRNNSTGGYLGVGGTGATTQGTLFEDNDNYNMKLDGENNAMISQSWFENSINDAHGIWIIGNDSNATNNKIVGNTINDTGSGTHDGIRIENGANAASFGVIEGNTISYSTRYGIYSDAAYWDIVGNVISNTTNDAIRSMGGQCNINNNIIRNVGADGIYCDGNQSVIAYNNISNSADNGIRSQASQCNINGNHCADNTNAGIRLYMGTGSILMGNQCYNNGVHGMHLSNTSSNNFITSNLLNSNTGSGIHLNQNCDNNVITYNKTRNNTVECIEVEDANCDTNHILFNITEEGDITNGGTGTEAFDNYDPSAGDWITKINGPADGR